MLFVCIFPLDILLRTQATQSPPQQASRPAELGIGAIAQSKNSKVKLCKCAFRQVRSQEEAPEGRCRGWKGAVARCGYDEDEGRCFVNEVSLQGDSNEWQASSQLNRTLG